MSESCCHGKNQSAVAPMAAAAATAPPQSAASHHQAPAVDSAWCHTDAVDRAHDGHVQTAHGNHAVNDSWASAARITLHCLTGCAIGEWTGLAIGVSLGWAVASTIALAVTLAFVFGFTLTIVPMVRRGMTVAQAFRIVWLGELVSIAVMELAMNVVDYQLGGMGPGMSLLHPQYWIAFSVAAAAGYLAALPANKWLLSRNLKKCH